MDLFLKRLLWPQEGGGNAGIEGNEDRQDRKLMGQEVRVWVYAGKGPPESDPGRRRKW